MGSIIYIEDAGKAAAATKQKADALQELKKQSLDYTEQRKREAEIEEKAKASGAGNEYTNKEKAKTIQEQINALLEEEKKKQEENRKSAAEGIKSIEDSMKGINASLAEFAAKFDAAVLTDRKITILLDETSYNDLMVKYNEIKSKEIEVTIRQKTVEAKATGGLVGVWNKAVTFARGGQLPGWGGGDKIQALLEAGEFVIRKEAVGKFGAGFFHMLNNLKLPDLSSWGNLNFNMPAPALPATARQAFATGGMVTGGDNNAGGMMTLDLKLGDTIIKTYTNRNNASAIKQLNKEIERSRRVGHQG